MVKLVWLQVEQKSSRSAQKTFLERLAEMLASTPVPILQGLWIKFSRDITECG
jgi:hypothetical protein